jgi:hypothetical protein
MYGFFQIPVIAQNQLKTREGKNDSNRIEPKLWA